ncbi:ABC transporter substrate-binding protein [Clostridium pasteurianum]|uniref:ABC transporter substrate-binding protein n=1 Tax=Clostridium pasteurianum TaxID=1501 RepID=UPI0022608495|nr:ABC transporter substrate-binding protein [Clostridium pasteurianum]UZW14158.1 ABC transporter substrate-binding protein [Clostridium pasteurianum]
MKNYLKIKKIISVILAVTTISLVMSSCSPGDNTSKSGEDISAPIQVYGELDPQVSAQQIIADKMGYFKEEGLNVTNHLAAGPDQNAPLVASGTAQVCFGATYDNIAVAANNVKIKLLAPLANATGTQCVVVRKGSNIKSAKDLEGKKVGMTSGAGILIAIRNMAKDLNVDINKIKFVNLQVADQLSAFEKGDIDAVAVWEPWVGKAVAAGGTILFSGKESYFAEKKGPVHWLDFYMTVQVTDKFYKEHPEQTVRLLKALNKATDYINNNPDKAAEIVSKEIHISKDDCKRIMSENTYSMKFDQQFVDGANTMAAFMKDMKNIKAVPNFYSYGFPDALRKANPDLVSVSK